MKRRLAINGLGRIGRLFLRAAIMNKDFRKNYEIVAFNDLTDPSSIAHLIRYDSVHGIFNANIKTKDDSILIDGLTIKMFSIANPLSLPWKNLKVDSVLESTGRFTNRTQAEDHIKAGAKKVVISAPAKGVDLTVVPGVNDKAYISKKHEIISVASCTTNCLAPMVKVLMDNFGVLRGLMTTIHAYTNDQRLLDLVHPKDLRRARAAGVSIIPTGTGAAKAIGIVIPELEGKLNGLALRVPIADGSITDLVAELKKEVTIEKINKAFQKASSDSLKGILEYTEDPIVSSDIIGNPHSCIIDGQSTMVLGEKNNFVKVFGWYDNEWGYSNRLVDVFNLIAKKW
jgi:glyceraldehyde-3-phosphate dehydrogenase type I